MKYQHQPPSNTGYGNPYGYGSYQPSQYNYYGKNQQVNMGMPPQVMNTQHQMPPQMMPQQQPNYNYGYPNYQMNMQPHHTSTFAQNQFYGGHQQEPPGYSLFGQQQYSNMNDQYPPTSNSPLWGTTGLSQQQTHTSQFYPQQQYYDPQYQGFENMGFYSQQNEGAGFYQQQPFGTPGDPHPSMFKSNQPQPKVRVKQESETEMRAGSWDPKFLQKSGIRKFHHNNGQGYTEGQIANWTNMKKSTGYSKVKKTKKFKNKKKDSKGQFDSHNIFTQTFGESEPQQTHFEPQPNPNQVPFLNIKNPPKTAKFNTFNQNLAKTKKSSESFGQNSSIAFKGQSFSETFHMQGPLKSSRMPHTDPVCHETGFGSLK